MSLYNYLNGSMNFQKVVTIREDRLEGISRKI